MNEKRVVMMKDETWWSRLFFSLWEKGGQDCSSGPLPKDCSPQKFSKKFFRVGVGGGFEWVGGIGNSGFVVGVVLGVIWCIYIYYMV